jgi:A nuclease family of the HNH/ENDO VII superfamily with conserved AHH
MAKSKRVQALTHNMFVPEVRQTMLALKEGMAGNVEGAKALIAGLKGKVDETTYNQLINMMTPINQLATRTVVNADTLSKAGPFDGLLEDLKMNYAQVLTANQERKAARGGGEPPVPKVPKKKPNEMTPAERYVDAAQKYDKVSNWKEVEGLIGQSVNKNMQLPPGYIFYEKPPNFYGKRDLFILRETADGGKFVPLKIEKGKIQAGTTRLSRNVMKANLKTEGIAVPEDWQINHLIPDEIAQSNPLMLEMLKRDIFDVDHVKNLLPMPGQAWVRKANPTLMGHQGPHDNYSRLIDRELSRAKDDLVQEYGSLNKIPDTVLKQEIEGIEKSARKRILKNDPSIPTRIDPNTGTKVISDAGLDDQELAS